MATLVHELFREMCERYPDGLFVATPPNPERPYAPEGIAHTYSGAAKRIAGLDSIPRTASQKTMKHAIFPAGYDPRTAPGVIDLRDRKKRPKEAAR